MKKKLSEGRENKRKALLRKRKEEPAAFWTYVVLRFIVILILIRCILRGDIERAPAAATLPALKMMQHN